MRTGSGSWLFRAAGWLAAAALFAVFSVDSVQAQVTGIRATKHNLGSGGTVSGQNKTTGTDEVCVFCHTPHAADSSAAVPLWNKQLPSGSSYTTYASLGSTTLDGQVLAVGSVSLACLSCHDGTQAMDNIINAPGPGGYSATGGGANGLAWSWNALGGRVDADGKLVNAADTLAMLGTDLKNDHPIGVQYCGGGQNTTTPSGACVDTDFVAPTNTSINGTRVWWVDTGTGTTGTREKTDMMLYNRDFGTGTTVSGPSVECATCHDPHAEPKSSGQVAFMRVSTAGSAICLSCHVK